MANKKINQLDNRVGVALTDLSLVGDPTTGTSFKLTIQDISVLMGVPGKFNQPTGTTSQYIRGDGSLATFPSLTGFVPYTGATTNVDLGTHRILAQNATIASSGSGDTFTLNHSSGSGIGLNITKGGNGEGLYINKTSGSGNAATIIGTLNATTLVKSGGTSSQFLKADGSVDSTTYVGGSGATGQVAYWNGTSSQTGSANLLWDNTNKRLGVGLITSGIWANYTSVLQVGQGFFVDYSPTPQFAISSNSYFNGTNAFVLRTGGSGSIDFGNNGDITIANGASQTAGSIYTGTTKMRLFTTGNLVLQSGGTFTDGGQRLQVIGDAFIKGSGATSATVGLLVQNSASTQLFTVRNDGVIFAGNTFTFSNTGTTTRLGFSFATFSNNISSGSLTGFNTTFSFTPDSGNATYTGFHFNTGIAQTGTASGITRGIWINPSITSAADWRSIEWSNNSGWGLYGAGTANNYLGGSLGIAATGLTGVSLFVNKNLTGSTGTYSIIGAGTIQSDSTSQAYYFLSSASTQNSTFTVGDVGHFVADQQTFGASSTVTRQYGVRVRANLIGAVNNFAFYGEIPNGTNRWNLYMNGTADNYLRGKLLINTTTVGTFDLDVNGTARVSGNLTAASFIRSGGTSAQILAADGSVITAGTNITISGGTISSSGGGGTTIYTGDGTLTGNRTVTSNTNSLTILGGSSNVFDTNEETGLILKSSGASKINVLAFDNVGSSKLFEIRSLPSGQFDILNRTNGISVFKYLASATGYDVELRKTKIGGNLQTTGTFYIGSGDPGSSIGLEIENFSGTTYINAINRTTTWTPLAIRGSQIDFTTNGSNTSRFTAAGRLLLNTVTESTFLLDVNGTARVSGAMLVGVSGNAIPNATQVARFVSNTTGSDVEINGNGYARLFFNDYSRGTDLKYYEMLNFLGDFKISRLNDTNTSRTERITIFGSTGNVFIGSSPVDSVYKLEVNGNTRITSTTGGTIIFGNFSTNYPAISFNGICDSTNYNFTSSSTDKTLYINAPSGSPIKFRINNDEKVMLTASGSLIVGGTTESASAIVRLDSTTKGFLPPRGTNTQMLAIASPATGLMFYDTTNNKLNCYDGTTWQACW
jgi:hypothetical protein